MSLTSNHLLINTLSARRGGGQTYLINLLDNIPQDSSLRITLLASEDSIFADHKYQLKKHIVSKKLNNPILRSLWEIFFAPFILRKLGVNIYFCPGGVVSTRFFIHRCKVVTMFRNMIPFDLTQRKKYPIGLRRLRNFLLKRVMLRSMEMADLVIFISNFAKGVILEASAKGIHEYVVIPHGIRKAFREREGLLDINMFSKGYEYIIYASTIDVYKSQLEVVKAFKLLKDKSIDPPRLMLVGAIEGEYGEEVKEYIKRNNLEDIVILAGLIPYKYMPSLYQRSEMIIFASQSENCPNILLESMASSKAILCSNFQPMPEFGGQGVEYFDPLNPEDLSPKLQELLQSKDKQQKLSEIAYAESMKFTWESSAGQTWNELEKLVE